MELHRAVAAQNVCNAACDGGLMLLIVEVQPATDSPRAVHHDHLRAHGERHDGCQRPVRPHQDANRRGNNSEGSRESPRTMLVKLDDILKGRSEKIAEQFAGTPLHVEAQAERVELTEKTGSQRGEYPFAHLQVKPVADMPHEHSTDHGDEKVGKGKRSGPPPHIGRNSPLSEHPINQPADRKNLKGDRKTMQGVEDGCDGQQRHVGTDNRPQDFAGCCLAGGKWVHRASARGTQDLEIFRFVTIIFPARAGSMSE